MLLTCAPLIAQEPAGPQKKPAQEEAQEESGAKGTLVLSTTEWDFGTKWYGEDCETEITLENAGSGPLRISRVTSSCGCTVAKPTKAPRWEGMVLTPGEKETMRLSYNTKKVRARVSQVVTIASNDPDAPTVRIQVKGSIKHPLKMTPTQRIIFTNLDSETQETRDLTLQSNLDEPLHLELQPLPENAKFDVKLETVEEGQTYKLTAKTKPPLNRGSNAVNVILKTDTERFPQISIPVNAYVIPRVRVSPIALYVPRASKSEITRFVRVQYQTKKPIEIKEVKVGDDSVKVEMMPPRTKPNPRASVAMHEIRVTLPPAEQFPKEGTKITILTDSDEPEYKELEVRVLLQPEPRRAMRGGRPRVIRPGQRAEAKKAAGKKDSQEPESDDKADEAEEGESDSP
jgi:hypothetical protein